MKQAEIQSGRAVDAPMGLHRLIYTSEAVNRPGTRGRPAPDAISIADRARERNEGLGLTGALAFVQNHFVQILEGSPRGLEEVFEGICSDVRHRKLTLVDYSPAERRHFANWAMFPLDARKLEDGEPLEDLLLSIRAGMNPNAIVRLMTELVQGETGEARA